MPLYLCKERVKMLLASSADIAIRYRVSPAFVTNINKTTHNKQHNASAQGPE
jgi:hypothetical protein